MNDIINNVLRRYDSFKAGDRSATADLDPTCELSHQLIHTHAYTRCRGMAVKGSKDKGISLIDFEDPNDEAAQAAKADAAADDDLAGLASLNLSSPAPTSSGNGFAGLDASSFTSSSRPQAGSSSSGSFWATMQPAVPSNGSSTPSTPQLASQKPGVPAGANYAALRDLPTTSSVNWGSAPAPAPATSPFASSFSQPQAQRTASPMMSSTPPISGGSRPGSTQPSFPQQQQQLSMPAMQPAAPQPQQAQQANKKQDPFGDLLDLKF